MRTMSTLASAELRKLLVLFSSTALAEPERCETNCDQIKEHPPILMESRPHAHSHGIRSVTFVLAISFHSIVEGLALGVQVGYST